MGSVENTVFNPIHVRSLPGADPSIKGAHLFSFVDVPGVVAANNYLAITNPVGSGTNIVMPFVHINTYAVGGTSIGASMKIIITDAASGGVLIPDSGVVTLSPTYPQPLAEIRTTNPTATLGPLLIGTPPPLSTGAGASSVAAFNLEANSVTGTYLLTEGESFMFRTEGGDADQRWNITIAWVELN